MLKAVFNYPFSNIVNTNSKGEDVDVYCLSTLDVSNLNE